MMKKLKFIDLFCGIGGFHHAMNEAASRIGADAECVFASDINEKCQHSYQENFGIEVGGDITKIEAADIPDHDLLFGGFPCQAFSIIGEMKGFEDTRGTLFFDIARIIKAKKPSGFVLENVKQLVGHDKGRTIKTIVSTLNELGYDIQFKVLNALDFGVPQKRERIFIVGMREELNFDFDLPERNVTTFTLSDILESDVPEKFFASDYIKEKRLAAVKAHQIEHGRPTVWHENKNGNISAYEFSCALRAGASYNYLLVDGIRRFTEREMLSLQGFPAKHKLVGSYSDIRQQAGNSLPVPVATEVVYELLRNNMEYITLNDSAKIEKCDNDKATAAA